MSLLLLTGAGLRLLTVLTFQPAIEFLQDSYDYLLNAQHLRPRATRPLLYPVALRGVGVFGDLALVPVLQHLAVLGGATLLYATLGRVGVRRWLAAVAAGPLLLDAYQLDVEQFIMSESLFEVLIVLAVCALLWREQPSTPLGVAAGLALAAVALTRSNGLPLLAPAFFLLLLGRPARRTLLGFVFAAALPLGGYAAWFAADNGSVGLQGYTGMMLASQAMTVADCHRFTVPAIEQPLCVPQPPKHRQSADWYAMHPSSPLRHLSPPPGQSYDAVAKDFALRVITAQPADFAAVSWRSFRHYFAPGRVTGRGDDPVTHWQFASVKLPTRYDRLQPLPDPYRGALPRIGSPNQTAVAVYGFGGRRLTPRIWAAGRQWLVSYQRHAYTSGPALALCAAISIIAAVGCRGPGTPPLRAAAALLATSGIGLLAVTAVGAAFQYRLLLPSLALLPPAGAVGIELLLTGRGCWRQAPGQRC